jgi:hypothetical protein
MMDLWNIINDDDDDDTDDLWAHMECKKHKKADTGDRSSAKVTSFLLHQDSNQMMLY